MSKFLAALLLMSPVGGNLVFVYSTSLDRAQEVLRAAKVYIDWIVTDPPQWAPKVAKASAHPPPHRHRPSNRPPRPGCQTDSNRRSVSDTDAKLVRTRLSPEPSLRARTSLEPLFRL